MKGSKRKYRWILRGLLALSLILLILALLLPWVINLESVRGKILAGASQAVGGQVNCEKIGLSLFPRPHVVVYQGSLSRPGELSGHSNSFAVYPEVLPLIVGKLRFSRVHVVDPVFTYELPKKRPLETKEKPKPVDPADILKALDPVMALLASKSPNLVVQSENGRIILAMDDELVFQYQNFRAQNDIPNKKMAFDITDFSFAIPGLADTKKKAQDSEGRKGSPEGNKELVIKGKSLKIGLDEAEDGATLSLNELSLEYPRLNLSGKFIIDQASPPIRLELRGEELDILSARQVALALAGGDPTIRDIFDIMRGGTIPLITFSSQGSMLAELDDTENMVFDAELVDGKVSITSVDLHMEGVKGGDIHISKGILYGKDLDARLGNTQARDGALKVGLEGEDAPFHLDILVDADLAQLPPILKRVVNNRAVVHELSLIDELKGAATGRLVLGESLLSIDARVDVSEFNLSAKYQRTPFPVEITEGGFFYDDTRIDLKKASVKMGRSWFSGLSAELDLKKPNFLKAELANSEISLEEFFPWLLSLELYSGMRNDFRSVTGTLELSASFDGPLLNTEKWKYEARGELKNLALDTAFFPWPVKVDKGSYDVLEQATGQRFSFKDARVSALDGTLVVSGVVKDYAKKGVNNADVTFQGHLGPEATRWVSEGINLPPEIRIRPPIAISKAHLVWDKDFRTSFMGNLVVHRNPKVSIDFMQTPKEVTMKNLHIQDKHSNFSMSLSLKRRDISLAFNGKLTEKTMRELHEGDPLLNGRMEGDFRARIFLDQPTRSTAQGKLTAQDLIVPWDLKVPLKINTIALTGQEKSINLESAVCEWGDSTFSLKGTLGSTETDLLFDMDLSTNLLDVNMLADGLGDTTKEESGKEPSDSWDLPFQGTLRLQSKNLTYEGYTWSPVVAHLSLERDTLSIAVTEANLCGISTPGNLEMTVKELRLDFEPVSKNQELDASIECLWGEKRVSTGKFDLEGKVLSQGRGEDIARSSNGNIEIVAQNGRIYAHDEFGVLGKVFTRLSVLDMFQGKFPDMKTEGLPYDSAKISANLQEGKLKIKEAVIKGEGMQVFGYGNVDLVDEKLDLEIAVAPFKTVDTVVKHTPIFGKILGGTLVSVPVKVTGNWRKPDVQAMPASSVGSGLLGIIKRTVTYPVDLVQPLTDKEKEK